MFGKTQFPNGQDSCVTAEYTVNQYKLLHVLMPLIFFFVSCSPQQQQCARFVATLAYYKTGLTSLISHNATEHLMWAVTCSQCR